MYMNKNAVLFSMLGFGFLAFAFMTFFVSFSDAAHMPYGVFPVIISGIILLIFALFFLYFAFASLIRFNIDAKKLFIITWVVLAVLFVSMFVYAKIYDSQRAVNEIREMKSLKLISVIDGIRNEDLWI